MAQQGLSFGVVGQNATAAGILATLAEAGFTAHALPSYDGSRYSKTPKIDCIIESVGGVEPALQTAMAAFNQGLGFITANPLLVAAHGRTLSHAAVGQQSFYGFEGALLGNIPLTPWLRQGMVTGLTAVLPDAPNTILTRMLQRNESATQAEAALRLMGSDMTDPTGKTTFARAVAIYGSLTGQWPRIGTLQRTTLDSLEKQDIQRLTRWGLQVRNTLAIMADGPHTGPMAVAAGSPLINANAQTTATLHLAETTLHLATETETPFAGLMADVQALASGQRYRLPKAPQATTQAQTLCYVRTPYRLREKALASFSIEQETTTETGSWQAIVHATPHAISQALGTVTTLPLAAEGWQPAAPALRLVG